MYDSFLFCGQGVFKQVDKLCIVYLTYTHKTHISKSSLFIVNFINKLYINIHTVLHRKFSYILSVGDYFSHIIHTAYKNYYILISNKEY